jgi:hypothetical protein
MKNARENALYEGNAPRKRNPINDEVFGANAQPKLKPIEKKLLI